MKKLNGEIHPKTFPELEVESPTNYYSKLIIYTENLVKEIPKSKT